MLEFREDFGTLSSVLDELLVEVAEVLKRGHVLGIAFNEIGEIVVIDGFVLREKWFPFG
jgi:hypothetical protein